MKKRLIVLFSSVLGFVPVLALAQGVSIGGTSSECVLAGNNGTLLTVLCRVGQILNSVVPVLIALGVVYFVWGVISYVVGGDEEAKKKGREKIIYGIIGLAVIVAVWGLVRILTNTFGVNNTSQIQLPTVPVIIP